MIRFTLFAWALLGMVGGIAVAADDPADQPEPPVRLKKKEKPKPSPAPEEKKPQPAPQDKKDGEKKDDEPEPMDPEQNEQEVLDRVAKNMRESEDRLNRKDAGDGTQQVQRDIVKDLESLIKQDQQSQQSSEQQSQQSQSQNQPQQKNSKASRSRSQRNQQARRRSGSQPQPQQTARNESKRNQGQQPNQQANSNQGGMGGKSQGPTNKLAELYKDVWGHLPDALRLEMEAYSREQFMAKYNELLKQYYSTIAEKGRRKGD